MLAEYVQSLCVAQELWLNIARSASCFDFCQEKLLALCKMCEHRVSEIYTNIDRGLALLNTLISVVY